MGTISRNEFQLSYAEEAAAHHSSGGEGSVPGDYFGNVFDYIKRMLMEEDDLEILPRRPQRPCLRAAAQFCRIANFPPPPILPPHHNSTNFHLFLQNSPIHDAAGVRKTHGRGNDNVKERCNKQSTGYADESVQLDIYDKSLLCPKQNPHFYDDSPPCLADETSDDNEEESKK